MLRNMFVSNDSNPPALQPRADRGPGLSDQARPDQYLVGSIAKLYLNRLCCFNHH
jgi:hypothetical protein